MDYVGLENDCYRRQMQQARMQQIVSKYSLPAYGTTISVPGISFDKVTTKEIEINKLLLLEEDV